MTPRSTYLFLAVGLVVASQSGNIIRLGHAHFIAIAAWRLGLAALMLAPLAGRDLGTLRKLTGVDRWLVLLAGLVLAAHFFAWVAAVQLTTVANATIFFSINPVITATAAHFLFGEAVSRRLVLAIALGLVGVVVIAADGIALGPGHLAGMGMALLCSVLFTAYFLLGKRLRRTLSSGTYVTAIYGVAALVGFATMAVLGLPAVDYDAQTWLCFALMALGPTMIGHTSFNHALRTMDAGRISVLTLTEPPLATIVAHFAWDEPITAGTVGGYALVALSVLVLVGDRPGPATTAR